MKLLSRRALCQLGALQEVMQELVDHRNTALRLFMASRYSTTPEAQREFWLEFSWIDQEYRAVVRRLAQFCVSHDEMTASGWDPR
jgi:hypothetical protein